ncbi:MAG: hypothetical protein QM650_18635 [Microlunatus sp.]
MLHAAEDAFMKVMAGVPEQLETMPPALDPADAIRWFGDRVSELVASLSEFPLEAMLGLDDPVKPANSPEAGDANSACRPSEDQRLAGEPLRVQAGAGTVAEVRVWVHPMGDLAPGTLRFSLSDLVAASGASIPGSLGTFAPAQLGTPITVGAGTLLQLPVPPDASPGDYHGHVFALGATTAAVPVVVTLT